MRRREFLLAGAAAVAIPGRAQRRRPPNIILMIADDLGYGETGPYGSTDIPTPHLDSIARGGVRFTNGYVSCPVCSPTRAGLMTGRYQQRFGHEFNPGPARDSDADFGLPLSETTLASRLKPAGYATALVGKWHLGFRPELQPLRRGFDEFYGFLGGAHSYLDALADSANPILRGTEPVKSISYATDDFAREAVSFIERNHQRPFFLDLAFNAVHNPLQSIGKYRARFSSITDQRRQTFAAMLSAMDDAIGNVLGTLRKHRIEEDTLIFFVSDNGGPTAQTTSKNGPLRGVKGQVWDGGIRVPFMVQWKGRLPAGRVYDHPVIALDIHPTAAAAAGLTLGLDAKLDGVNLLPYLSGEKKERPHESLYWRFGSQSAIRFQDWKLVMLPGAPPQLFDLAKDGGEKTDLAAQQPDRVRQLSATYDAWNRELAEPRWQRGGAGKQKQKKRQKKRMLAI